MAIKRIDRETQNSVALLAAHGASVTKISRETGLHHKTVKKVLQEPRVIATQAELEDRLASKFEQLAESILDSVSEDDLLKASLQQKSISAATMIDKARLVRGLSTQNSAVILASAVVAAHAEMGQVD